MADLVSTVWVRNPENSEMVAFGPGDTVPGWAKKQMGPHCFVGGTAEEPPSEDGGAGSEPKPYKDWTKGELQEEVDRRNEGRVDDDLIEVGGKGNKPDLVAALEADDEAAAAAGADTE